MKLQYIAPETETILTNTGNLLGVSGNGIPYGGVDENGEKEPAAKGIFGEEIF